MMLSGFFKLISNDTDAELCSVGDLVQPGNYSLHSRFERVLNFSDGFSITSVVKPNIGNGPGSIVLKGLNFADFHTLNVSLNKIILGNNCFFIKKNLVYDSTIPKLKPHQICPEGLQAIKKIVLSEADENSLVYLLEPSRISKLPNGFKRNLAKRFIEGIKMLNQGKFEKGVSIIQGLGPGLTPSGDDFLTGMLIGLHIQGSNIPEIPTTKNLISNTFLSHAAEGRIHENVKTLLEALRDMKLIEVQRWTKKIIHDMGMTSGADFSIGFLKTIENGWFYENKGTNSQG